MWHGPIFVLEIHSKQLRRTYQVCPSLSLMRLRSQTPSDLLNVSTSTWRFSRLNRRRGPFPSYSATCSPFYSKLHLTSSTCSRRFKWHTVHVDCWHSDHRLCFTIAYAAPFHSTTNPSIRSAKGSREAPSGMICGIKTSGIKSPRSGTRTHDSIVFVCGTSTIRAMKRRKSKPTSKRQQKIKNKGVNGISKRKRKKGQITIFMHYSRRRNLFFTWVIWYFVVNSNQKLLLFLSRIKKE